MTLFFMLMLNLLQVVTADTTRNPFERKHLDSTGATQTESTIFWTATDFVPHLFESTSTSTESSAIGLIPTSTPTETSALLNLSSSHVNTTLFTLDVSGHDVPMICANCSTSGELNVTGYRSDFFDPARGEVEQHGINFTGVHVRTELPKGFKGYIELELSTKSSLSHSFTLWELPVFGFIIPSVGKAGVSVSVSIPLSLQVDAPANATFGFNFSVPEGSFIHIDTGNLENSTKQGFTQGDGLEYGMLPIHVTTEPGQGFNLSAALQFEVIVGAQLLDNLAAADIGARLKLPALEVSEFEVSSGDDACNPLAVSVRDTHRANYTITVPSIGVALDIFVEADLSASSKVLGTVEKIGLSHKKDVALFDTTSALPTICIALHRETSSSRSEVTAGAKPTTSAQDASPNHSGTTHSAASGLTSNTPTSTAKSDTNKCEFRWHNGLTYEGATVPLIVTFLSLVAA